MKLPITNIIKETDQAVTVCFKNNRFFNKLKYKPGQFLTIKIPIDGRIEKRAYSFSSSPYTDKELKITVKKVENGLISNYVNNELKVGQTIAVEKPMGSFYIDPDTKNQKQYALFAAGSGITPVFSILKSVLTKEPNSTVLLVYANLNKENIIFYKELLELLNYYQDRLNVEHILSENTNPKFHSGFITKNIVQKVFAKNHIAFLEEHEYMICGPAGFMKTTKEILKDNHVPVNKIKVEAFKPAKVKVDNKNLISKVTIKLNDKTHIIEVPGDKTILQQAMKENIVLPYSCRSGMCSSCKANCSSGETTMIKGHLLPESEVNEGKILTCVTYPTSEELTIEILN
jgi:ring-1,2-phenylacetyl-CoA epoxidase subunit PaaE